MIFVLSWKVAWFLLSQEVAWFFLSWEVAWFILTQKFAWYFVPRGYEIFLSCEFPAFLSWEVARFIFVPRGCMIFLSHEVLWFFFDPRVTGFFVVKGFFHQVLCFLCLYGKVYPEELVLEIKLTCYGQKMKGLTVWFSQTSKSKLWTKLLSKMLQTLW